VVMVAHTMHHDSHSSRRCSQHACQSMIITAEIQRCDGSQAISFNKCSSTQIVGWLMWHLKTVKTDLMYSSNTSRRSIFDRSSYSGSPSSLAVAFRHGVLAC